jgi:hypothetical protein
MSALVRSPLAWLALLALFASASVAAQAVYKWTDEKGVVHYSDQPPPDSQAAERLNIKTLGRHRMDAQQEAEANADETSERPDSAACTTARQNLVVFENNDVIRMDLDGDGTSEELTPEQREQELTRTRDLIALLCR